MSIVAVCPYCRAGGVRAPDRAAGAVATCPKCGSHFTVVPDEALPEWAKPAAASSSSPRPHSTPAAPPPATNDIRPYSTAADVTEPSPVLPPVLRPPVVVPSVPAFEPPAAAEAGFTVALAAAVLFGVAMLATLFPFGRAIALVLAVVGFSVGFGCLLAEGRARLVGPAAGMLHLAAIALLLFAPRWLALEPWREVVTDDAPKGPQAVGHGTGLMAPADWVDASTASWQVRDVRVSVASAVVGPIELTGPNGAKQTPKETYLQLSVRVANEGVERRIELSGWATGNGGEGFTLTDLAGKLLRPKAFEGAWQPVAVPKVTGLYPGKSAETLFWFDAPPGRVEYLRLELPGSAVGVEKSVRFQIPGSFLKQRRTP